MMLGEDQHAALVAALRNQPQYHAYSAPASSGYSKDIADWVKNTQNAGKSDAQQYADEFGQYDPQFAAMQAKTPDEGSFMNGLQNKWNGLFGGASG